jgi:hypothetical protein
LRVRGRGASATGARRKGFAAIDSLVVADRRLLPVGLDYWIWPGQPGGLGSSLSHFSTVYLLVRCLLSCLVALARGEVSRNAELLVLWHENAVLRRQAGRVRYQPGDRLWLAALSRLIPRRRWSEVFAVTPATLLACGLAPAADRT